MLILGQSAFKICIVYTITLTILKTLCQPNIKILNSDFLATLVALDFPESGSADFLRGSLILILGQSTFQICIVYTLTLDIFNTFLTKHKTPDFFICHFLILEQYISENIWFLALAISKTILLNLNGLDFLENRSSVLYIV